MPILFLLFFFATTVQAESTDVCEVLNLSNCAGVSRMLRRSSSQSLPSSSTAAQFNPANVSHDRGFGIEAMYQSHNSPSFSVVTGTGKAGAALVSSKIENAFFGNSVPELEESYLDRRKEKMQYSSDKYTFALGLALWKGRDAGLDAGLLVKYNTELKRANPGVGLSGRLWFLTFGASIYQDDFKLKFNGEENPRTENDYEDEWDSKTYQERFLVQNMFAGIKIQNLFLDAGLIKSHYKFYDDDTVIRIYSAAFIWRNFMINVAKRQEDSASQRFNGDKLVDGRKKNESYAGIQYSFNKHFVAGIHHNYYMLREVAGSLTAFY